MQISEAAVAAGVSIPQIHRIIDEKILPEDLYSTAQMRTFRPDACVLIAFYFETAELLTAQARLRAIRSAMAHCGSWRDWENCVVEDHSITVRFSEIAKGVRSRLRQLLQAHEMVIEDPEILSGTPVIKGTRVPVYDIAAAVDAGIAKDRILKSYPSLKDWQVELASIYAKAVPLRGRPKRVSSDGVRKGPVTKKRLRSSLSGGSA
ncbi:MAG TPA: DUF433 domain-containing protein [Acidobacteriaceae bacterium]|nr:DUF433 domain-containing protein [Acidobacteriaceae bacterium]